MSEPPPPPFWRTQYFERSMAKKPDRLRIAMDDIAAVVAAPISRQLQDDGRWQMWGRDAADRHWLRIVVLPDEETVHNAFRDRGFRP